MKDEIYAMKLQQALRELIDAIDSKWHGESERKRANAISPRMEDAISAARALLPSDHKPNPGKVQIHKKFYECKEVK